MALAYASIPMEGRAAELRRRSRARRHRQGSGVRTRDRSRPSLLVRAIRGICTRRRRLGDFVSLDGRPCGRLNAQFDSAASNVDHFHANFVVDSKGLLDLSSHNKHDAYIPVESPILVVVKESVSSSALGRQVDWRDGRGRRLKCERRPRRPLSSVRGKGDLGDDVRGGDTPGLRTTWRQGKRIKKPRATRPLLPPPSVLRPTVALGN